MRIFFTILKKIVPHYSRFQSKEEEKGKNILADKGKKFSLQLLTANKNGRRNRSVAGNPLEIDASEVIIHQQQSDR